MRSIKSPSWIERLLGLEPQPLPSTVFGVDGSGLRAVWREDAGDSLRTAVAPLASSPFQEGPLGGPVQDESALSSALDRLFESMPAPRTATLVIPDAWFRLTFVEAPDLPRSGRGREEMLRWRLQQLVPFRVDDLRVRAQNLGLPSPGDDEEQASAVLVGFAIEVLLRSLEDAFSERGVRIGNIVSESLALVSGESRQEATVGLVLALRSGGYSLLAHHRGLPIVARFNRGPSTDGGRSPVTSLVREIALSRRKVSELMAGEEISSSALFAEDGAYSQADLHRLQTALPGKVSMISPEQFALGTAAVGSLDAFIPLAAATLGVMS